MSGVAAGAELRAKLAVALPLLRATSARMWQAPGLRERYTEYLCAMHMVVRASVPLMETALRRCTAVGGADPVADRLAGYLRRHVAEERDHDRWLLADLAALGHDPDEVRRVPSPPVARMVGAQYYWVLHHHPVCLLGYVAVLEGSPPPPSLVTYLRARTGHPDDAFRTLRAHADLDTAHGAAVFGLLDALPLSAAQRAAVGLSALHTVSCAASLLADLTAREPGVRPFAPPAASTERTPP
jgi:Iron-containing redox enzyme